MLTKFETKTARVKGLSFHPKRPWILASLHNGSVQIWDYRMGTVIDTYTEHEGPVRGCAFHPTQPLFATCGDDNKVRVFNFQQKKCLFVLSGHQDYVRSITFHHESPWLMTASDDQTIRIWNWQSRACVAQLTGHSHYVMCAQFHPKEDLVVSASLDQTIRVWDISYLRRKGSVTPMDDPMGSGRAGQIDLFASSDGQVKFVLEGHDRGVNWVAFHPSKPLIVSGSDDRSVRLWRYNDSRAWETDTFRGHLNNVSCVTFHPTLDLIISASEDRSVRVWDYGKKGSSPAQTFRRDSERYWIIAGHPTLGLFAAGHDGGLQVFKLERERPPQLVLDESLFFVRGASLIRRDLSKPDGTEAALVTLASAPVLPATLDYSPSDRAFLISSGSEYDLVGRTSRHGLGAYAQFLASGGRFAVLDEAGQRLCIRSVADGSDIASIALPIPGIERIFGGSPDGSLLLASQTMVVLFDVEHQAVLAELEASRVKRVAWSPDGRRLALLSRKGLLLVDAMLNQVGGVTEHVPVKSAVWEDSSMLFYTTPHQLKYVLPTGETGIVCTTESPLYLVRVQGGSVAALDRSAVLQTLSVDPAEWQFKLALLAGDLPRVLAIIAGSTSMVGQSPIAYLRAHGYAALALNFVEDPQSRLELALEAADWEVAASAAESLGSAEAWLRLAEAARRLGNPALAMRAYDEAGQPEQGLFLSALCATNNDANSALSTRLHSAMLRGDSAKLASALEESKLGPLAYLARCSAGLAAGRVPAGADTEYISSIGKLQPCRPLNPCSATWPLSRPLFDFDLPAMEQQQQAEHHFVDEISGGWEQDELPASEYTDFASAAAAVQENPLLATRLPLLHILAGSLESAKRLLTAQAGIINFDPMQPLFERLGKNASVLGAFVCRFEDVGEPPVTIATLKADLKSGLALTTEGKFADAIAAFTRLLQAAPLALLEGDEASELDELLANARHYIIALGIELERKELLAKHAADGAALPPSVATRILELAAYFASCPLLPTHRILAARSAMTLAFRLRQLSLAARMARRLLDLHPGDQAISAQAEKVIAAAKQTPVDPSAILSIAFDDHLDFDLDAAAHTPIYPGQATADCPYCEARYASAMKGSVCLVCNLAAIGSTGTGIQLTLS